MSLEKTIMDDYELMCMFMNDSYYKYMIDDIYSELKSAASHPKVYLVNTLDELRNQIDIECQKYLNRKNLGIELKMKALEQQQEMINEVDLFQKKCLDNLAKNPLDQVNLEEIEHRSSRL